MRFGEFVGGAKTFGRLPDRGMTKVALVLHTTETGGMPGFNHGETAPHFVYKPKGGTWVQMAEVNRRVGTMKGGPASPDQWRCRSRHPAQDNERERMQTLQLLNDVRGRRGAYGGTTSSVSLPRDLPFGGNERTPRAVMSIDLLGCRRKGAQRALLPPRFDGDSEDSRKSLGIDRASTCEPLEHLPVRLRCREPQLPRGGQR